MARTAYTRVEHTGGVADTTLGSGISNSDTTFTLAAAVGPTGSTGNFMWIFEPGTANEEHVWCSGRSGTTVTVLTGGRGADGTSAVSHASGVTLRHGLTETEVDEANVAVANTVGKVTAKGSMLAGTGANAMAEVAVGANGTVVQADSAQSSGVKFATVGTSGIADSAVTTAKLNDASVTSAKIADGTIATGDIASGAITSALIADGTIVTADLADSSVTSAKIVDATIATGDIADSAITSAKIADGTIVAGDIASNAVTTAKIIDGAVTAAKLASTALGAQVSIEAPVSSGVDKSITTSQTTMYNGTVNGPSNGGTITAFCLAVVNIYTTATSLKVASFHFGFSGNTIGQDKSVSIDGSDPGTKYQTVVLAGLLNFSGSGTINVQAQMTTGATGDIHCGTCDVLVIGLVTA